MSTPNYELARILVEGSATFANGNAEMVDALVRTEEAVAKAGLDLNALNDPTLIPKNIGESRPDLIGRYLVSIMKISQLNTKMQDVVKLTLPEKKELAKQYHAAAEELKSLIKEIGK